MKKKKTAQKKTANNLSVDQIFRCILTLSLAPAKDSKSVQESVIFKLNCREDNFLSVKREKAFMEMFSGLAIPDLLQTGVSAELRKALVLFLERGLVIEKFAGGPMHKAGLTEEETIAVWLITLEHLQLFRKKKFLYIDISPFNILAMKKPFSTRLIDFEGVRLVREDNLYHSSDMNAVPLIKPPELLDGKVVSESVVIYQLGFTLIHCLCSMDNDNRFEGRKPDQRFVEFIKKKPEWNKFLKLLHLCIEMDPLKRPQNYERLWEAVSKIIVLPGYEKCYSSYAKLRKPYSKRIREILKECE